MLCSVDLCLGFVLLLRVEKFICYSFVGLVPLWIYNISKIFSIRVKWINEINRRVNVIYF